MTYSLPTRSQSSSSMSLRDDGARQMHIPLKKCMFYCKIKLKKYCKSNGSWKLLVSQCRELQGVMQIKIHYIWANRQDYFQNQVLQEERLDNAEVLAAWERDNLSLRMFNRTSIHQILQRSKTHGS